MGRGGCNCCGDWVTTAKVAKTSGALLWNYNYGMDTLCLLPIEDSMYIFPRNVENTNSIILKSQSRKNTTFVEYSISNQEAIKRIDINGKYLGGTRESILDRRNYSYNYYNTRAQQSTNQNAITTQSKNNRCLVSSTTHTIFEKDEESSSNIVDKYDDNTVMFDKNITIIPKYVSVNHCSQFGYNRFEDNYNYYNNTSYENSLGTPKYRQSTNNRLVYLSDDYLLQYSQSLSISQNESMSNITYDENGKITFDISYSSIDTSELFSKFQFQDKIYVSGVVVGAINRIAQVTNIVQDDSTAETRLLVGDWHIDFDNSGYTFSPTAGIFPDPIYSSLIINSFDITAESFSANLSFDKLGYDPFAIGELLYRFRRLYLYYANVTLDVYEMNNIYVRTDVKDLLFKTTDLSLGENAIIRDLIITDAGEPIFEKNSYSYNSTQSIKTYNLETKEVNNLIINDIIDDTSIYDDIASEFGYELVDISTPIASSVITLTSSERNDINSGVTSLLGKIGLSDDILGLYIYMGRDRYNQLYNYINLSDFIEHNGVNSLCLKIGYDNKYYGIFASLFTLTSVKYTARMEVVPTSVTPIPDRRDYTVTVSYQLKIFKRFQRSFKLMFDIDGSNSSYKFIDLDCKLGYLYNDYYSYYNEYQYFLNSYEDSEPIIGIPILPGMISQYFGSYGYYGPYGYGGYGDGYGGYGYTYGVYGLGYNYNHFGRYNTERDFINIEKNVDITFSLRDEDEVKTNLDNTRNTRYTESATILNVQHQISLDHSNINYACPTRNSVYIPVDRDYLNTRHITSSGTIGPWYRPSLSHYTNISGITGAIDYTTSSNTGSTFDIGYNISSGISTICTTLRIIGDDGNFISGYFIPKPVCMTKDVDSTYVGMCTTSNRVAIYTGIQNTPISFDGSYFIKSDDELYDISRSFVYDDVYDFFDGFNTWVSSMDSSKAYSPRECIWLIPDFNRETIDIEKSKSVKVYIQDKYFELNLLDTAEEIKDKVVSLGYDDIYVYGGPIVDRAICITGFNSIEFENFIPGFAVNDSLGKYITKDNTNYYDYYDDYYINGYAFNYYSRFYRDYDYDNNLNEYYIENFKVNKQYNVQTIINTADDFTKSVTQHPAFYPRIISILIDEFAETNGYGPPSTMSSDDMNQLLQDFQQSRSGKLPGTLVSQDGFVTPDIKYINADGKSTYDFNITTDEYIKSKKYPEMFDIDYIRQASGNMSVFFHHGLMCKVENSTTGFKSKQAALMKIGSDGSVDWTTDYGYKPFIQKKDEDGNDLEKTIEKNVHFNGKIQDIKYHSGEVYITGNMINLDAIDPKAFNNFSEYYNNVVLQRYEIEQKKRDSIISPANQVLVDVLGDYHKVTYENYKIRDLNDPK